MSVSRDWQRKTSETVQRKTIAPSDPRRLEAFHSLSWPVFLVAVWIRVVHRYAFVCDYVRRYREQGLMRILVACRVAALVLILLFPFALRFTSQSAWSSLLTVVEVAVLILPGFTQAPPRLLTSRQVRVDHAHTRAIDLHAQRHAALITRRAAESGLHGLSRHVGDGRREARRHVDEEEHADHLLRLHEDVAGAVQRVHRGVDALLRAVTESARGGPGDGPGGGCGSRGEVRAPAPRAAALRLRAACSAR